MKLMLAAFIISSIDIRMTMALRRVSTPTMPIANSSRLKTRAWAGGTGTVVSSVFLARQNDGADHRDEQQHRGDLERQQVLAVERPADLLQISPLGRQVRGSAEAGHESAAGRYVEQQRRGGAPHDRRHRGMHAHAPSGSGG